jgi:DNA-3-methyladenine glycosylase II
MWFPGGAPRVDWSVAEKRLSRDPVMRAVIVGVGPCTPAPRRDYFVKLCQSIFTQQISTKVAAVLFHRFRGHFANKRPTPGAVLEFLRTRDEETIRSVGLSRQKRRYVEDLAEHFASGKVRTRRFAAMDDEAVVQALLPIMGIGRWTVEMFLIFCLNRPDVWPVDDLGVRVNVGKAHGMKEMPTKKELAAMGERWRPWRTIASWYLWRYGDVLGAEAKALRSGAARRAREAARLKVGPRTAPVAAAGHSRGRRKA